MLVKFDKFDRSQKFCVLGVHQEMNVLGPWVRHCPKIRDKKKCEVLTRTEGEPDDNRYPLDRQQMCPYCLIHGNSLVRAVCSCLTSTPAPAITHLPRVSSPVSWTIVLPPLHRTSSERRATSCVLHLPCFQWHLDKSDCRVSCTSYTSLLTLEQWLIDLQEDLQERTSSAPWLSFLK